MSFIDQWRVQIEESLVVYAKLISTVPDVDLKYEILIVGVLWPVRQPIQNFDLEAVEAVQAIVGEERAKSILSMVQQWADDPLVVARHLATQSPRSGELGATFDKLVRYFNAFPLFARQLATQKPSATIAPKPAKKTIEIATRQPRVFVYHVREDDQTLAAEVRQRLDAEGIPIWPDLTVREGERNWWQQTARAIDQVAFLILVMTPAALTSDNVRRQWRYARQKGVCVYPVFKAQELDFSLLPNWIRQVHFYNLNLEWPKLISNLNGNCETPRIPFMVEDIPPDFVGRTAEMNQLIAHLFDQKREEAIATTVALYGPGGYGKSTLAKAVCYDDDIRNVFDNGILWVTLGQRPGDLSRYIIDLIEILSGERPGFTSLDAAVIRFSELIASRDILLVIDDVWNAAHIKPFLQGGPGCARLVTTRDIAMLPIDTRIVNVGPMQQNEAVALLGNNLPYVQLDQMRRLAHRLGQWPLLLKLVNGALRQGIYKDHHNPEEALIQINEILDEQGLTAFDIENSAERAQAVSHTLEVGLKRLNESERARYNELIVFPVDTNIPLTTLEKLWSATGGLDDFDTEELCDHFQDLSLLSHFDLNDRYLRLHGVMHNYLTHKKVVNLPELHSLLADVHKPDRVSSGENSDFATKSIWSNMPFEEPYMWTHLAYHLIEAGRQSELLNVVKDLNYLTTKIQVRGTYYAEHDIALAEEMVPTDQTLNLVRRTISQTSHLLVRCKQLNEITNILHSRLIHLHGLGEIMLKANNLPRPLLTARHLLPDLPDSALIRTLRGHASGVLDCAISGDGTTIVSVDKDNTVMTWAAETGAERVNFRLSGAEVWACDICGDGSGVIIGLNDGRLILYDATTGIERLSWQAHSAGIMSCAINTDASMVVSASKDTTLKVWDAQTGRVHSTFTGHQRTVSGCGISADGKTVVSISNDGILKVWDTQSGREQRTFVMRFVNIGIDQLTFFSQRNVSFTCAISRDGTTVVGASSGGTITVWDMESGSERLTITADKRGVHRCAVDAKGAIVAGALSNGILKLWDAASGADRLTLADHTRTVNSCALNADGSLIVSASNDRTLKLWDGRYKRPDTAQAESQIAAHSCTISADGTVAVSAMANKTLKVWDVATGEERLTLKAHSRKINDCAISPDGSTIVSASQDQTLIVWDAQTGDKRCKLTGHTWSINGCAINIDNSIVVSASDDKTLKVWDIQTGVERFTLPGHTRMVNACAIGAQGQTLVSASGDGTLKVWDPNLGTLRRTLRGHTAWIDSCAISVDERLIVSASYDKTLKIWDMQTETECLTLRGHTSTVTGCAISADGAVVISSSRDKTVRVWDVQTGNCLTTLYVDEPLLDCTCSADASTIMAVGNSGVYFLRLER